MQSGTTLAIADVKTSLDPIARLVLRQEPAALAATRFSISCLELFLQIYQRSYDNKSEHSNSSGLRGSQQT
jgi:hypothetical protein